MLVCSHARIVDVEAVARSSSFARFHSVTFYAKSMEHRIGNWLGESLSSVAVREVVSHIQWLTHDHLSLTIKCGHFRVERVHGTSFVHSKLHVKLIGVS